MRDLRLPGRGGICAKAALLAGDSETGAAIAPAYGATQLLNRKMLLDMRDSLRAFLTLLERR